MGRQYDCYLLCPDAYILLSDPTSLADMLGYDSVDDFYEAFFMDNKEADLSDFQKDFKLWNQEVPGGYGYNSCYITPVQRVEGKPYLADGLICDINDAVCGEDCEYRVFLLSTEAWDII